MYIYSTLYVYILYIICICTIAHHLDVILSSLYQKLISGDRRCSYYSFRTFNAQSPAKHMLPLMVSDCQKTAVLYNEIWPQ